MRLLVCEWPAHGHLGIPSTRVERADFNTMPAILVRSGHCGCHVECAPSPTSVVRRTVCRAVARELRASTTGKAARTTIAEAPREVNRSADLRTVGWPGARSSIAFARVVFAELEPDGIARTMEDDTWSVSSQLEIHLSLMRLDRLLACCTAATGAHAGPDLQGGFLRKRPGTDLLPDDVAECFFTRQSSARPMSTRPHSSTKSPTATPRMWSDRRTRSRGRSGDGRF